MHDKADAILVLIAIPLPRRLGRPKSDEGGSKAKAGLPRRSLPKAGPASCHALCQRTAGILYERREKFCFPETKNAVFAIFYTGWMPRGFKNTFNHE